MHTTENTPTPAPPKRRPTKTASETAALFEHGQKIFLTALNKSVGCLELSLDGTILSANDAYLLKPDSTKPKGERQGCASLPFDYLPWHDSCM